MKKHVLRKGLLSIAAIMGTLSLQSCQSCQSQSADTRPCSPPPKNACDEHKEDDCHKCKKGCPDEEASSEAMIHVIEIDQPDSPNVSVEAAPSTPAVEAPETAMETSTAPAPVASETSVTNAASIPSVLHGVETVAKETAVSESPVVEKPTAESSVQK